ncbi:restriction endonuclease [Porcincola intestinalis]|uniref:Restriction endonuclease n=1 Tax=Porcincola intestinalis TaxID=2606632 RepID=A0A6L5X0V8_9FIRM|nr:restriction endonuclease [Porcincola intestinalis]MCI6697814.1 hypothetical protein [Lachnospiraceae bacterium]MSS13900.1 restriction endonuclease [Porcincola intestinalis]
MNEDTYERTIDELETHACKWWPKEIRDEAEKVSILQTLINTQDKFISIFTLAKPENPDSIFSLLDAADISYNMFLKHLMVLLDFGSEPLQRINNNASELFPDGNLNYSINGNTYSYTFSTFPVKGVLNNAKMKVDTIENLTSGTHDADLCRDIIMLLVYGASSSDYKTRAVLYKGIGSDYIGDSKRLTKFVKTNYMRVSRIVAGKTSNDLGHAAQYYVRDELARMLGDEYNVRTDGTIPGVTENDGETDMTFDVVVDKKNDTRRHKQYVGIEVMFQETTNSVIERKSGQARNRFEKVSASRNHVAYIIDGAGSFQRRSATRTICENSHCTVALTPEELVVLKNFIKEKIG